MSDSGGKPPKASARTRTVGARGPKPASDAAFDIWLQQGLHKMYDDIAGEPLPEEWLKLIEQDRKG
jgi:hypothetical protein